MKLTEFPDLQQAVFALGGSKQVRKLVRRLSTGYADLDVDDIVIGEAGIYLVSDDGILSRVIVNIVDANIDRSYFGPEYAEMVRTGDFDNEDLVKKIHKYHLLKCSTIERAETQGWRDKYKMSQRSDGRFYYRFNSDSTVLSERTDQKLLVCGNCFKVLLNDRTVPAGTTKSNFSPQLFFESAEDNSLVVLEERGQFAEQSLPNKYAWDWRLIANKFKSKKDHRCESPQCPAPDLSDPKMRQYLHAHHRNMDKSNNNFSNLQALCVCCHAEQPGHSHMKATEDYKYYVGLLKVKSAV